MSEKRSLDSNSTLPCGRPQPKASGSNENLASLYEAARKKLERFVTQKNLKQSEVREKILEVIVYEVRHFRAQSLLERLHSKYPEVGKATLYRTLPILLESGIIQEGPVDSEGQIYFELTEQAHHDHIVCLDCHKIFEFHDSIIEGRQEVLSNALQFTVKNHQHVIYTNCNYFRNAP